MDQLTTGEIAKRGRVNRETIRYYERRKLLPKPLRSMSGYRLFSNDAVRRLRFIRRAKALGFSLREIKELLGLRIDSRSTCHDVRARAEAKIADIDQRIETLRQMKKALIRLVASCSSRGPVINCPILESLDSDSLDGKDSDV